MPTTIGYALSSDSPNTYLEWGYAYYKKVRGDGIWLIPDNLQFFKEYYPRVVSECPIDNLEDFEKYTNLVYSELSEGMDALIADELYYITILSTDETQNFIDDLNEPTSAPAPDGAYSLYELLEGFYADGFVDSNEVVKYLLDTRRWENGIPIEPWAIPWAQMRIEEIFHEIGVHQHSY